MDASADGRGKLGRFQQAARSFAEQWPYLRYLGFGAWWAWIWLCYHSSELMALVPEAQRLSYVALMYAASTSAIGAIMVLSALFWKRAARIVEDRWVVVAFGALAALSTAFIGMFPQQLGLAAFVAGSALTGLGTSLICLRTGAVYGTLALRESLTAGSVSLIFASFLYFMGIGLPAQGRVLFIAALPLISALLLVMPGDDPLSSDGRTLAAGLPGRSAPGRRSFRNLVVASALIAATAGVAKGMATAGADSQPFSLVGPTSVFLIALFSVGLAFMVNVGGLVRSVKRSYYALMLWGVAVLLASFFGLSLSYLVIGKELLWMLFSCLMAYMAFRFDFSPVRAFGLGQAAYFIASLVAWRLGAFLSVGAAAPVFASAVQIAFAFVIVLILTFVFTDADIKFILTWGRAPKLREGAPGEPGLASAPASAHAFDRLLRAPDLSRPESAPAGPDAAGLPQSPSDGGGEADAPASREEAPGQGPSGEGLSEADLAAAGLSQREIEIMELFAGGRSANWIADSLMISSNTVRSHIRAIYVKLGVHTRQELIDRIARP